MNRAMSWMLVALAAFGLGGGTVLAGNTNSLASPTNDPSNLGAMWTLNDIYNVLDTRTTNVTLRGGGTSFVEPTSGPTGTMHTLNEIMTLVTNRAPLAMQVQTNVYFPGDAGTQTNGVAWPVPRFTIGTGLNGTNCVTDNLTGLMWSRNASLGGNLNWTNALNYVASMNAAVKYGYSDWRLPNLREMQSLFVLPYSTANTPALTDTTGTNQYTIARGPWTSLITGWSAARYWTSTTYPPTTNNAYIVATDLALTSNLAKSDTTPYVWLVRGGSR